VGESGEDLVNRERGGVYGPGRKLRRPGGEGGRVYRLGSGVYRPGRE
jgi:hypothetical protein